MYLWTRLSISFIVSIVLGKSFLYYHFRLTLKVNLAEIVLIENIHAQQWINFWNSFKRCGTRTVNSLCTTRLFSTFWCSFLCNVSYARKGVILWLKFYTRIYYKWKCIKIKFNLIPPFVKIYLNNFTNNLQYSRLWNSQ